MKRTAFETVRRAKGTRGLAAVILLSLAGCATPQLPPAVSPAMELPVANPAPKAPGEAPAHPITVAEATTRAVACNPQLQALRAAARVAKQRQSAATDIEDPEALTAWGNGGDGFGDPGSTSDNQKEWRVGGRLPLPNPFLLVPRVSARTADLLTSKADLQSAAWLLECDVRRLYAQLDYLREDVALAEDLARANDEILKDVRARAEQGAATSSDVVTASQKQLQAEDDLTLTRHRYQLAQRELAAFLEMPPAALHISTNGLTYPSFTAAAAGFNSLQWIALHCRGDLNALRWRTAAAKSARSEARNGRIPWPKELTVWNREPGNEQWIGAAISLPVFSWTKNHAEDVLQAQYDLAAVNETSGVQRVRREVADALDELVEQHREQARDQTQTVPLLAEMRRTLRVLKTTPNLMPSQIAATEAQVLDSTRIELASSWRYQLAWLNLERAVGQPLSEALDVTGRKP